MLLEVERVRKRMGGLVAVNDVSCSIERGQVVGIIGPNGAGKTTLFNLITAYRRPDAGRIRFDGHDIIGLRADQICRLGLVRTFQHAQPFPDLTALENAMIGAFVRHRERRAAEAQALRALALVDMADRAGTRGRDLRPADLKRLELARAIATEPTMLLLDEVMAGLRPLETEAIVQCIRKLNRGGITVLFIEHVVGAIRALAQKIVVLHHGEKLAEGRPEEIFEDQAVIDAYFGREWAGAAS